MLIYYFGNWKFGCKDTTFNFKGKFSRDSKKMNVRFFILCEKIKNRTENR